MSSQNASPKPDPWGLFPATKTIAHYDSLSQFIELSEIESRELKEVLSDLSSHVRRALGIFPLLLHELRHWLTV